MDAATPSGSEGDGSSAAPIAERLLGFVQDQFLPLALLTAMVIG
jgi:hypothetical protein